MFFTGFCINFTVLYHPIFEVICMNSNFSPAILFGTMLRENSEAARFYDGCTMEQRQAILCQLQSISTPEEMRSFVAHLPSAAT